MRQIFRSLITFVIVACGLIPGGQAVGALPAVVDGEPLPSLAPVLETVTPSVVNIYTKTRVRIRSPLLDDPFFRRFFNVPDVPRERVSQSLGSGVIVDATVDLDLNLLGIVDVDVEGRLQINTTDVDKDSYRGATIGGDGSLTFGDINRCSVEAITGTVLCNDPWLGEYILGAVTQPQDTDGDGIPDLTDPCPNDVLDDQDADGVGDPLRRDVGQPGRSARKRLGRRRAVRLGGQRRNDPVRRLRPAFGCRLLLPGPRRCGGSAGRDARQRTRADGSRGSGPRRRHRGRIGVR